MVDVSTSRRKADVLAVSQQDFPQVGYIKIPGHNESSLGLRGLILSITPYSSSVG